jgi:hypothetical protein
MSAMKAAESACNVGALLSSVSSGRHHATTNSAVVGRGGIVGDVGRLLIGSGVGSYLRSFLPNFARLKILFQK